MVADLLELVERVRGTDALICPVERLWAGHPQARDGLAGLLREGVAAWLEAWSKVPVPPGSAVPVARPARSCRTASAKR